MADQDIAEGVGALSVQETVRGGNTVSMVPFVRIVSHFDRTHVQTLTEAERAERQAAKKAAKAKAKARPQPAGEPLPDPLSPAMVKMHYIGIFVTFLVVLVGLAGVMVLLGAR